MILFSPRFRDILPGMGQAKPSRLLYLLILSALLVAACDLLYRDKPEEYSLSYDGNGNTGGDVPPRARYEEGSVITVAGAGNLVQRGYRFGGWKTQAAGPAAEYQGGASLLMHCDTILYAHWVKIQAEPTPEPKPETPPAPDPDPEPETVPEPGQDQAPAETPVSEPETPPEERQFYAVDVRDNSWYRLTALKAAEGAHGIIYADRALKAAISPAQAEAIVSEYERNIYPKMTEAFGTVEDVDGNGKTIFLILDVRDGYTDSNDAYTGGYFHSYHMYPHNNTTPYSNQADMLFLDAYPTVVGSSSFYATMAHEYQHLIEWSQTVALNKPEKDIWINEGLSTAAEYLYGGEEGATVSLSGEYLTGYYYGDPANRVLEYFLNDHSIAYGNNFFVWNGFWESSAAGKYQDAVGNYDTAYLFFQWLRIHCDNPSGKGAAVYKEIIASPFDDYRAVTTAAAAHNDSIAILKDDAERWKKMLSSWYLSNVLHRGATGLIGYGKDPRFSSMLDTLIEFIEEASNQVNNTQYDLTSLADGKVFKGDGSTVKLYPGEGVYSQINNGSRGTTSILPVAAFIGYAGIDTTSAVVDDEGTDGISGHLMLTFNTNTDSRAVSQSAAGKLAATVSAAPARQASRLVKPAISLPRRGPVDIRVISGGSLP